MALATAYFAPKTSRPQYDPSADDEPHDCVCVLSVGEPFRYVIPSFDVIAIEMRQLKVKGYTGKYGVPVCFNTVTAIASFAPSPEIGSTWLSLSLTWTSELSATSHTELVQTLQKCWGSMGFDPLSERVLLNLSVKAEETPQKDTSSC